MQIALAADRKPKRPSSSRNRLRRSCGAKEDAAFGDAHTFDEPDLSVIHGEGLQ